MAPSSMPWRQVLLYGALSLADLCLTWFLIHTGQGTFYESNPIAGAWLSAYGWAGLAFFKLLCVALVVVVSLLLALRIPKAGRRILTFACVVTAAVNIYSLVLIGYFAYHDTSLVDRFRPPSAAVSTSTFLPKVPQSAQLGVPSKHEPARRAVEMKHPAVWLTAWPPKEEFFPRPTLPGAARFDTFSPEHF